MINTILASTVVAAILTQLVNIVLTLSNNKRIRAIEKQKIQRESDSFRYKLLFDILKEEKHIGVDFDKGHSIEDTDEPEDIIRKSQKNFNNKYESLLKTYSSIHVRSREQIRILKALLDEVFLNEILDLNNQGEECLRSIVYLDIQLEKRRKELLSEEILSSDKVSDYLTHQKSEMMNKIRELMSIVGDCSRKIEEAIQKQLRLLNSMR